MRILHNPNRQVVLLKSHINSHGGLEKQTRCIASAWIKRNASVSILTTQTPEKKEEGVHYQVFPKSHWLGFRQLEAFDEAVRHWLKEHRPGIILGMDRNRIQTHLRAGNGIHASYLKSRIASEGRSKYWTCLINPLHRKILELEKAALLHSGLKKIFVNSCMVREELLSYYPVDCTKVQVIHNGVEWLDWERSFSVWEESKARLLIQFNLDPSVFHLLFVGNGFQRKGLDVLLSALSLLSVKDVHLSVIGKDKQIAFYQQKVKKLGLARRVHFFGQQQDIIPFYQLADALAIPSFYDPFANVTVEALAMGLFVISSKSNGGHEILTQQSGTVIENLLSPSSMLASLNHALQFKKTTSSAKQIRSTVEHLDFSHQLETLINACE